MAWLGVGKVFSKSAFEYVFDWWRKQAIFCQLRTECILFYFITLILMHVFSLIYFDILRTGFNEYGNLENNLDILCEAQ